MNSIDSKQKDSKQLSIEAKQIEKLFVHIAEVISDYFFTVKDYVANFMQVQAIYEDLYQRDSEPTADGDTMPTEQEIMSQDMLVDYSIVSILGNQSHITKILQKFSDDLDGEEISLLKQMKANPPRWVIFEPPTPADPKYGWVAPTLEEDDPAYGHSLKVAGSPDQAIYTIYDFVAQQAVAVYSTFLQEDVITPEDIFPYKSCLAAAIDCGSYLIFLNGYVYSLHGPRELVASIHAINPALSASIGTNAAITRWFNQFAEMHFLYGYVYENDDTNERPAVHGRYWRELRLQIHDLLPEIVDITLQAIPGRWIRSTTTINTSTIPILPGTAGGWGMPSFEDPGDNSRSPTPSRLKKLTVSRLSLVASNEALRDYFSQKQMQQLVQRFIGLEDTVSDTPLEDIIHSIIKTVPMAYLIHELDLICISGQSVMAYITASMLLTSVFIPQDIQLKRFLRFDTLGLETIDALLEEPILPKGKRWDKYSLPWSWLDDAYIVANHPNLRDRP